MALVVGVAVPEGCAQQRLFGVDPPDVDGTEDDAGDGSGDPVSEAEAVADPDEEAAAVAGMAYESVGAAVDDGLVVEGAEGAGVVPAEGGHGPGAHGESGGEERDAGPPPAGRDVGDGSNRERDVDGDDGEVGAEYEPGAASVAVLGLPR